MSEPREGEKRHMLDDPKNVRRLLQFFWVLCALMVAGDLVVHRHPSFQPSEMDEEALFGFYPVYGFVACGLLILIAKQLRKVLMRSEDYYDR